MGQFFIVLFSIITGFYILGVILRLFFRIWIARKMKQFQEKGSFTSDFGGFKGFSGTYGGFNGAGRSNGNGKTGNPQEGDRREGEVKITATGDEHKKIKDKVGEYVDFDEVK